MNDTNRIGPILHVTKLDAAKRQLRAAIRLWFDDGDPVAIHTLVHASYELIHSLFKKQGLSGLIFDSDMIKDEYRGDWAKSVKKNANFFKHAREDPEGALDFAPALNDYVILFSIIGLRKMEGSIGKEESLFIYWININRPDLLKKGSHDAIPADVIKELRCLDKREFREMFYSTFADSFA